jgi:hypothetical protein
MAAGTEAMAVAVDLGEIEGRKVRITNGRANGERLHPLD